MTTRRLAASAFLAVSVASCDLPRELAPSTEPVLVVQAVLNTALDSQYVVVQSTDAGVFPTGGPDLIPNLPPPLPVSGAEVILEHLTPPSGCTVPVVVLSEARLPDPSVFEDGALTSRTGVYLAGRWCPLRPGDQARLTVRASGQVVTGTTTIPSVGTVSVGLRAGENGPDTLLMHRERDSVWVSTAGGTGAAVQYEVGRRERHEISLDLAGRTIDLYRVPFSYITDTAGAVPFPGTLVLPFEDEEGLDLFQPGRYYVLTVAATDRNYFDYARSGGDMFTGHGFINHLEGGIGVFGGVDPTSHVVKVVTGRRMPDEGIYRVTGALGAEFVDVTLDLYRTQIPGGPHPLDRHPVSAFVEGTWGGAPITAAADGFLGETARFLVSIFVGEATQGAENAAPATLALEFLTGTPPDTVRYVLGAERAEPGQPFTLIAYSARGGLTRHTLIAVQETSGQPGSEIGAALQRLENTRRRE